MKFSLSGFFWGFFAVFCLAFFFFPPRREHIVSSHLCLCLEHIVRILLEHFFSSWEEALNLNNIPKLSFMHHNIFHISMFLEKKLTSALIVLGLFSGARLVLLAFNEYLKSYDYKMSLSIMNRMKMWSQKHLIMQCWFPKTENSPK